MELITGTLSREQILGQVSEISRFFQSMGVDKLLVEYGWGAGVRQDEMWKEILVPTDELPTFVESSITNKFFVPGVADLFIKDESSIIRFKLCHEADIHMTTEKESAFERVAQSWTAKGFKMHKSSVNKECNGGNRG